MRRKTVAECVALLGRATLVGAFMLLKTAFAGDVVMLPVSLYGQPLAGCVVTGFSPVDGTPGPRPDLRDQFEGLTGRGIPSGDYKASLQCGEYTLSHRLKVEEREQIEVVDQFIGVMHEGKGPALVISMDPGYKGTEKYWVQLLGIYNGVRSSGEISDQITERGIAAPYSGSYIVVVLSTSGAQCVKEVDLVQFTRHWLFHPATCTLSPDRFAHIVTEEDKSNHRQGDWYREMEREWKRFFRQLNAGR